MLTKHFKTHHSCHIDRMGDISCFVLEIPRHCVLSGMTLSAIKTRCGATDILLPNIIC